MSEEIREKKRERWGRKKGEIERKKERGIIYRERRRRLEIVGNRYLEG